MDEAVRETALPSRGGVCPRTGEKRKRYVARRDDYFVLGVFLIIIIKEDPQRWHKGDRQGNAFFLVLLFSIANVVIDIVSSIAMNQSTEWWMYEYAMTLYVASMPLLAAVWVCYEYVLIHRDEGTAPSCAASWVSCFRTLSLSPWPSRTRGRSGSST